MERAGGRIFSLRCEKLQSYDVLIGRPLNDGPDGPLAEALRCTTSLVITTPTVDRLYGPSLRRWIDASGVRAEVEVISVTEAEKTMESVLTVCNAARRHGLARRDLLIAFGGGVCCDVVAMAASLVRRGIPYVCLPTTLLAQVDAGIGVKGAVNFGGAKSYLGCFAPPAGVFYDTEWLITLPQDALRAGMAEILKLGLIRDAELFWEVVDHSDRLLQTGFSDSQGTGQHVIGRSVELLLDELQTDCYENHSLQRLLDLGHTFSGRLEELSGYRLSHGMAVAIDIALSTAIAAELGMLNAEESDRILDAVKAVGLPIFSTLCISHEMTEAMRAVARHRGGDLNLVVPLTIGRAGFIPRTEDIPAPALAAAIDRLHQRSEGSAQQLGEARAVGSNSELIVSSAVGVVGA